MPHQFLYFGSRRSEVFSRIEFLWVFGEGFSDARSHGQAQVGVDIDLGAANAASDFDVGLGNPGGVGAQFAAVLVDFLDQVLRDTGSPVEHEWIITQARIQERLFDRFEPFQVEVLFAFEFVGAVGIANRDGQRIDR